MYSGKTTVGRRLAQELGYQFVDLDKLFEATFRTSIPLFFQRYGEESFRKLEQKVLHSTGEQEDVVISTGGGTPCHFDNMEWINAHGVSIYLDVGFDALMQRAAQSKNVRPILAGKPYDECKTFMQEQLLLRVPYYSKARLIVKEDAPDIRHLVELLAVFRDGQ